MKNPLIILGLLTASFAANSQHLIYEEGFEGSSFADKYVKKQVGTPYGLTVSDLVAFPGGTKSARFELRDTDPKQSNGSRSEILFPAFTNNNRWYRFDVYFPSTGWAFDSKEDIFSQFHQGGGTSPSISFETKAGLMRLRIRQNPPPAEKVTIPLGPVIQDRWQSFVMHIIHSHDEDGLIEIWLNGVKIVDRPGPNSYDFTFFDHSKWKLGIYKWLWNDGKKTDTNLRVIYFDNIRLGDENASYEEMTTDTGGGSGGKRPKK